jgi:hypothetical protein
VSQYYSAFIYENIIDDCLALFSILSTMEVLVALSEVPLLVVDVVPPCSLLEA